MEKKKKVMDFIEKVREHIRKENESGWFDYQKLADLIKKNRQAIEKDRGNIAQLNERFNAYGTTDKSDVEFSERNP